MQIKTRLKKAFMNIEEEINLISAIIPTLGFILSTVSADLVKKIWMKKFYKNGETYHGR